MVILKFYFLWQTAYMVVIQVMVYNFAFLFNCTKVSQSSDLMTAPFSRNKVGTWRSISVVGRNLVLFVLSCGLASDRHIKPFAWFITVFVIICVSLIFPVMFHWCGRGPNTYLYITKTCLYSFDPRKPRFYIVKLGFTGVYIIFLFSAQNIDCSTR